MNDLNPAVRTKQKELQSAKALYQRLEERLRVAVSNLERADVAARESEMAYRAAISAENRSESVDQKQTESKRKAWAQASEEKATAQLILETLESDLEEAKASFFKTEAECADAFRKYYAARAEEAIQKLQSTRNTVREVYVLLRMAGSIIRWDEWFLQGIFGPEPVLSDGRHRLEAELKSNTL